MTSELSPRIYVVSLSDYNNGVVHGAWIDAAQSAADIAADVAEMLKSSRCQPAEEWAIHDYKDFGGITIGESESFKTVAEVATGIAEHGPAWAAYVNYQGGLEWDSSFEDDYCGEWENEEAYAEELLDDIGELKDGSLASRYFDYESFTRDLFAGDYYSVLAVNGNVYVFRRS